MDQAKRELLKLFDDDEFIDWLLTLIFERINPNRVPAMRRKLKKLAVKVQCEETSYENVENMFRGWMGSFYKLLSRDQRKNLIKLYEDLFDKAITVINKKLVVSDRSPQ